MFLHGFSLTVTFTFFIYHPSFSTLHQIPVELDYEINTTLIYVKLYSKEMIRPA